MQESDRDVGQVRRRGNITQPLSVSVAGQLLSFMSMSVSMIYGSYSDAGNSQNEKYDYRWLITLALTYQVAGTSTDRWEARLRSGGGSLPIHHPSSQSSCQSLSVGGVFLSAGGSFPDRSDSEWLTPLQRGLKRLAEGWRARRWPCVRAYVFKSHGLNVVRFTPANLASKQWHAGTSLFSLTHAQNSRQSKTTSAPPIGGHQWLSVNEHASVSLCASVCLHAPVRVSLALPKVSSPIEVFLNSIVPYSSTGHWGEKLNLSPAPGRPLLFHGKQDLHVSPLSRKPDGSHGNLSNCPREALDWRQVCRGVPAFNARLSLCLSLWLNAPSRLIESSAGVTGATVGAICLFKGVVCFVWRQKWRKFQMNVKQLQKWVILSIIMSHKA